VAVNASALVKSSHQFLPSVKKDNDFNDSIYSSMFVTMLANCACVPVLAWLDTPTVVQYFKKWQHFQVCGASNFLNSGKKIK
jgi:hypothetical protein